MCSGADSRRELRVPRCEVDLAGDRLSARSAGGSLRRLDLCSGSNGLAFQVVQEFLDDYVVLTPNHQWPHQTEHPAGSPSELVTDQGATASSVQ